MQEPFKFVGADLTVQQCEQISLKRVNEQFRRIDSALMKQKWFDYRHMHPVKATYLFVHQYNQAVRAEFARTRDVDEAKKLQALFQNTFNCIETLALWKARQAFDALCVRYDFAIGFAMKRCDSRGWKFFPRPNQLYAEEVILDIRDAWAKHCLEILELPVHPRFKNEYYIGNQDQLAVHEWIIKNCKRRAMPHMPLSRAFRENLLPEEVAVNAFGVEVVRKAKLLSA